MKNSMGEILKKCRTSAKISVKEISETLTEKGYKASESTIYSWENDNSSPSPGALLEMCNVYGVHDVLKTFGYNGYNNDGSIRLNIHEIDLIEKYRDLDDYGRETINIMLNRELERIEKMRNQKEPAPIIIEVFPTRRYLQSASAGYGNFNDDSSYEMMDLVKRPPVGTSFIISVNGDSMEPTYSDGTLLFVKAQERVDVGQIGLFVKAGNLYIKEFGRDGLISHNKNGNYPLIYSEIDSPIITQGRIIGVCSDDYLPRK